MDLNNGVCGHDHPCFKLIEEVRWRLSDVEAYTLSHVDRDANKFANVFFNLLLYLSFTAPSPNVENEQFLIE